MCPDPQFRFLGGWWSPCLTCGRLAWNHEQPDPLADLRNQIHAAQLGLGPEVYPPVMRKEV